MVYRVTGTKSGRKRFAAAVVLGVAGLTVTDSAYATQAIFDSITNATEFGSFAPNRFNGTTGFSGTQDPLTDTQQGSAITVAPGISAIYGFNLGFINTTDTYPEGATTFTNFQINAYYWGTVNTGTINASSPAFSNLLGSASFNLSAGTAGLGLGAFDLTGGGLLLDTPIPLNGATTLGVSYEIQGSVDGGTTYAPYAGLEPAFTEGQPFAAGATLANSTYINVNGEQNGNFTHAPLVVYNLGTGAIYQNQAVATVVYGPPTAYYWASTNSPDGEFETATNWTPNGVPGTIDSANFNLASSGYTVSLPNTFLEISTLAVQNDNVTLDQPGVTAQVYLTNKLTVGQPVGTATTATGSLTITNSVSQQTNLFEAASIAVGGNGGTGTLTVGSLIFLLSDGDTYIGPGSSLVVQQFGKFESTTLTIAGSTNAWTGTLDIGQSALKLTGGDIATVMNQLKTGFNKGAWNGPGIISSAAAADTTHLTAVGAILNNDGHGNKIYGSGTALGVFDAANELVNADGSNVDNLLTDVLIRYTYYGDANLDGTVDGSDYTLIDNGFLNHLTGWYNGDFNYDGVVDGSDYTLIDNAFNNEQGPVAIQDLAHAHLGAGEYARGLGADGGVTAQPLDGSGTARSTAQIATASVPEPTTLGLLGMAAIPALRRRRAAR